MADEVTLPEDFGMIDGAACGECSACKAKDQRIAELEQRVFELEAQNDKLYTDDYVEGACSAERERWQGRIAELESQLAEVRKQLADTEECLLASKKYLYATAGDNDELERQLAASQERERQLEATIRQQQEHIEATNRVLRATDERNDKLDLDNIRLRGACNRASDVLAEARLQIEYMEKKFAAGTGNGEAVKAKIRDAIKLIEDSRKAHTEEPCQSN